MRTILVWVQLMCGNHVSGCYCTHVLTRRVAGVWILSRLQWNWSRDLEWPAVRLARELPGAELPFGKWPCLPSKVNSSNNLVGLLRPVEPGLALLRVSLRALESCCCHLACKVPWLPLPTCAREWLLPSSVQGSVISQTNVPSFAYTDGSRSGVACFERSRREGLRTDSAWRRSDLDLQTWPVPEHVVICNDQGPFVYLNTMIELPSYMRSPLDVYCPCGPSWTIEWLS